MFSDFFKSASDLGLKYIDNKYVSPPPKDTNATAKQQQAQKYEQIQQQAAPAPVAKPINTQYMLIGGGIVAVVALALVFKK